MDKKKILLIDDETDLCMFVKLNLENTGEFEVTFAYSGEEGLQKVKETEFDLVITDYHLKGMDGKAVLKFLKETRRNLPVILFSIYYDDASTIAFSTKEKADATISKPFDHEDLYKTIKEVLAKSEKENNSKYS